jgi:hypothetical protein
MRLLEEFGPFKYMTCDFSGSTGSGVLIGLVCECVAGQWIFGLVSECLRTTNIDSPSDEVRYVEGGHAF